MRRGLWRTEHPRLKYKAPWFDLIIEPGELARSAHINPTPPDRTQFALTRPIINLFSEDLLDPTTASQHLGLANRPTVLVHAPSLGPAASDSPISIVANALADRGWQIITTSRFLRENLGRGNICKYVVSDHLGTYLNVLDLLISPSGYNIFHEALFTGTPAVWIPDTSKPLDNQCIRAQFAHDQDIGYHLSPTPSSSDIMDALSVVTDRTWRNAVAPRCSALWPGNGAYDAARLISLLSTTRVRPISLKAWNVLRTGPPRHIPLSSLEALSRSPHVYPLSILLRKWREKAMWSFKKASAAVSVDHQAADGPGRGG
jgi:UDP:flavonoid glycosyltransferase YjiC (YdhE family)